MGEKVKKCRKCDTPKKQKQAKRNIDNPLILSISKNKNISFYIHIPPHHHTTNRLPFRRLLAPVRLTITHTLHLCV